MPEQITTVAGEHVTVTVLPAVGARVHGIEAFGRNVLHTPADPSEHRRDPFFWGGYHMAPWCNRLEPGPVRVGRRTVDLAANFPDGTAIHGQVYDAPWEERGDGEFGVSGGGAGGWPWTYEVSLQVGVSGAQVRLDYALTSTADDPMPAGIGFHPWFRPAAVARFGARRAFPGNLATPPEPSPVTGEFDVRGDGPLAPDIDSTWTDLEPPAIRLDWADGLVMTMDTDHPDAALVAANPVARGVTAVELQTHAPDGLRRLLNGEPYGMRLLDPGDTLAFAIVLSFDDSGDDPGHDPRVTS